MKVFLSLDFSYMYFSISLYTLKHNNLIKKLGFYKKNNCTNKVLFFLFLKTILNKTQIALSEINYIVYGKTIGDLTNIKKIKCMSKGIAYIFNIPILKLSKLKAIALGAWFDYNYSYIVSCIKLSKNIYNIGTFHFINKGSFFHIPITLSKETKINIKKPIVYSANTPFFTFNHFLYTGKGSLYFHRHIFFKLFFLENERIPESIYLIRLALYYL